jgi:hypothetical protein
MANKKTPKKKPQKELYAGPNFQNSPCPSSLPVPDFSSSFKDSVGFSPQKRDSPMLKDSPLLRESPPLPQQEDEEIFPMEGPFQFVHPQLNGMFPVQYNPGSGFAGYGTGYGYQFQPSYPPVPMQAPVYTNTQYASQKITNDSELDQMSKNLKNVLGL